jgi:hypothetical protein
MAKMDLSRPALRVMARCVCGRHPLGGGLQPRLESIPATPKTEGMTMPEIWTEVASVMHALPIHLIAVFYL